MNINVVIKPAGQCNFVCKYCYNEEGESKIMTRKTLKRMVSELFDYVKQMGPEARLTFIWHGGEPMLAGIDFFQEALSLQKQYSEGRDVIYSNAIQTNGSLITEKWANFFLVNNFDTSVSLDGPKEIHNKARVYRNDVGTFDQVMHGINHLKKLNVKFGVVSVVSKIAKDYVDEIYDFFSHENLSFHIVPLAKLGRAVNNFEDLSISPDDYAAFWIKMYDKWMLSQDQQYVYCKDFVNQSATILTGKSSDCASLSQCACSNLSIDSSGNVFPCGMLTSRSNWCYGNITKEKLTKIMGNASCIKTQNRKKDKTCAKCEWERICHGGCFARAEGYFGSADNKDYYCTGLKKIYQHVTLRLKEKGLID